MVGSAIRRLRREHGLTQTELSSRIGIQQSDLSRMEKGEYRVSLDTLFRILGEFDVGIAEFFEGAASDNLSPRDLQLVRDIKKLPTEARREVYDLVARKQELQTVPANH